MDYFINFFFEYWTIIVPCLLGIIEFIFILIFKKRPKIIDNSITDFVLSLCNSAELQFGPGKGKEKLDYVLANCQAKFGLSYLILKPMIMKIIESILECQSK